MIPLLENICLERQNERVRRILVLLILSLGFFWIGVGFWYLSQPKIMVAPHHNVVATIRQRLLGQLSRRRLVTNTVILISTDHFGKNQHRIVTTSRNDSLFPLAVADNEAIYADHGIMNMIPDIYRNFPQAQVFPLILGNEVRITELEQLFVQILSHCGADCVVIASVDFSHYLPAAIAMTHDAFSIQALSNLDAKKAWQAETDSPQTLWLTVKLAESWHAPRWVTHIQTNSSVMINDPWYESTSHVFGWYQGGLALKKQDLRSFTVINATSSAGLDLLGKRLTYGADGMDVSCNIPLADDVVMTGWETKDTLFIGLLPIRLTADGYVWQRYMTQLPVTDCNKTVVLLPGTAN